MLDFKADCVILIEARPTISAKMCPNQVFDLWRYPQRLRRTSALKVARTPEKRQYDQYCAITEKRCEMGVN